MSPRTCTEGQVLEEQSPERPRQIEGICQEDLHEIQQGLIEIPPPTKEEPLETV